MASHNLETFPEELFNATGSVWGSSDEEELATWCRDNNVFLAAQERVHLKLKTKEGERQ